MIKVITKNKTYVFKNEKELDDWYYKQPKQFRLSEVISIESDNPVDKAFEERLNSKSKKNEK